MNCSQTEKISLLIDRELPPAEAQAVERHLLECSECHQAREYFLSLRSQIVSFPSLPDPAVTNLALAKILSEQDATITSAMPAPGWRNRFLGTFAFQPRFAAAALVLAAVIIGSIALLRQPSPGEVVSNNTVSPAPPTSADAPDKLGSSDSAALQDELAKNLKPKGSKAGPREGRRPKSLNIRGTKPARDRNTPNRPPQPRNEAPSTYAVIDDDLSAPGIAPSRHADTLAVRHLEQSELLLRAFRNVRSVKKGAGTEVGYERRRAQQLVYQNILLRREADTTGDVQLSTLLNSLEPILLDIANLRNKPRQEEVRAIKERVERKSLVALLQINSSALARANE